MSTHNQATDCCLDQGPYPNALVWECKFDLSGDLVYTPVLKPFPILSTSRAAVARAARKWLTGFRASNGLLHAP
jgi:hypothetical protein